jgi:hypothetical protein
MARTPRPIQYVFKIGKGKVKARRESENPTRTVLEQVTLQYLNDSWDATRKRLAETIASDVRSELVFVAGQFRRNVIGAPGNQRGLVGTLTTKARGGTEPKESLGRLPRWAPRGARYLEDKKSFTGHQNWFDNTGWEGQGGTLANFFASDRVATEGGAEINVGSGGILEDMFGGINVQIIRNNQMTGRNSGAIKVGPDGKTNDIQVATIRVRALGAVTERMMQISDQPNTALLDVIGREDKEVALHLRGGRGRYRPTLEPYLRFFLERSIPQAVQQRLAKGVASGRLFRRAS